MSYNVYYCIQEDDADQDSSSSSEQNGRLRGVIAPVLNVNVFSLSGV